MLKARLIWQKDVRCRKRWELSCFQSKAEPQTRLRNGPKAGKESREDDSGVAGPWGAALLRGRGIHIQFTRKDRSGTDIFYGAKSTRANAVAPVTGAS